MGHASSFLNFFFLNTTFVRNSSFCRSVIGRQLGVTPAGMGLIIPIIWVCGIIVRTLLSGLADK